MKRILNKLYSFFRNPHRLMFLNLFIILVAILVNIKYQVFCIPVFWSLPILLICFLSVIVSPVLEKYKKLSPAIGFLNGVAACVFLYCIIFLEEFSYTGVLLILFFGLGLLILIPQFFLLQLVWKYAFRPKFRST